MDTVKRSLISLIEGIVVGRGLEPIFDTGIHVESTGMFRPAPCNGSMRFHRKRVVRRLCYVSSIDYHRLVWKRFVDYEL